MASTVTTLPSVPAEAPSGLDGLFSLPPELRLEIYSYIPLPKRGWYDISLRPPDLRWLLASRRIFADATPHCNVSGFSTSLQPKLPGSGVVPDANLWEAFARSTRGHFGEFGEGNESGVPDWLAEDASLLIKELKVAILLPPGEDGGDCLPSLAVETISGLLAGVERFAALRSLRVSVSQHNHFERCVENGRKRRSSEPHDVVVRTEFVEATEEVRRLVRGKEGCMVYVEIAGFARKEE